jgi:DNA-directed RNA polymerase subunit RPC12/RpoP
VPVLEIACPDCGHRSRSLVLAGAPIPSTWVCSACGGRSAEPVGEVEDTHHPWACDGMHGCCG